MNPLTPLHARLMGGGEARRRATEVNRLGTREQKQHNESGVIQLPEFYRSYRDGNAKHFPIHFCVHVVLERSSREAWALKQTERSTRLGFTLLNIKDFHVQTSRILVRICSRKPKVSAFYTLVGSWGGEASGRVEGEMEGCQGKWKQQQLQPIPMTPNDALQGRANNFSDSSFDGMN